MKVLIVNIFLKYKMCGVISRPDDRFMVICSQSTGAMRKRSHDAIVSAILWWTRNFDADRASAFTLSRYCIVSNLDAIVMLSTIARYLCI